MPKYLTRSARVAVTAALLSAAGLTSTALADESVVDRSAFSTTVRAGDAFKTRTYPEQINFKDDDGDWSAIDRSLESKSDGSVRPAAIDGDAVIPSTLAKPVVLEHDGRTVSFRLLGADADADRDVSGSKASFDDALAGVDVSYKVRPNGLKELIELGSRSSQRSFSYDVRADSDLSAAIVGGGLVFTDDAGKERFRVAAPLAWDSAELAETSDALTLSVSKTADRRWRLTMRADDKWLDDPARVFPVTLDPDYVYPTPDNYWIDGYQRFHGANQDCAMAGNDLANQNRCAYTALQIGYGNNRPYKSVMKFDVAAAIPSYARVTASRFLAWQFPSSTKANQSSRLRTVTSPWDNTATWNKRIGTTSWTTAGGDVSTAANLTGDPITIGPSGYWSYWPAPLAAVSGWIKGTLPNYGFQISTDNTYPNVVSAYEFTSTDGAQQSWPALEVTWVKDTIAPTPITVTGTGSADQTYLGGSATGTITATATDENSGIDQIDLLRDGTPVSVTGVACPGNTCPLTATEALEYSTTGWTEGAHTMTIRAYDAAGNISLSAPWTVYVDRGAPTVTDTPDATSDDADVIIDWSTDDPDLADGSDGSGSGVDLIRFQNTSTGVWSAWQDAPGQSAVTTTAASSVVVQVTYKDNAGNQQVSSPATLSVVVPDGMPFDDTGEPDDPEVPENRNCAALSYCAIAEPAAATFAAAAATSGPVTYSKTNAEWGLTDPDRASNLNHDQGSFITNAFAQSVAKHVRILVPFNVMKWDRRRIALAKQVAAAGDAGKPVLLTFEVGCRRDAPVDRIAVSCNNNNDDSAKTYVPRKWEVNNQALLIMRRLVDENNRPLAPFIHWFGVWNEPAHDNQPFRTASPNKNGNRAGLQRLTEQLTDKTRGVCASWNCKIVSAEVEMSTKSTSDILRYSNKYADWLSSNRKLNRKVIEFYGAHDYGEVYEARTSPASSAKRSKLGSWMKKLPNNSAVWLAEIGVYTRTDPPKGPDLNATERANQATFLFQKLSRLKVGSNGARVAKASYYQFCPANSTGFDTSLFEFEDGTPNTADCTIKANANGSTPAVLETRRTEITQALYDASR